MECPKLQKNIFGFRFFNSLLHMESPIGYYMGLLFLKIFAKQKSLTGMTEALCCSFYCGDVDFAYV